jgi:hypothetical protein
MFAHAGAADESVAVAMLVGACWLGWIGWSRLRGKGFARVPTAVAVGLLVVAVGVAAASAVVPRRLLGPTPVASTGPRIASTATLAFTEPAAGARVRGGEVRVVLDLAGATVLETATGPVTPDTGHIHLSVDGTLVSMTYGTVQVLDVQAFDPGAHTIEAEFVAADHLPFSPPVTADVTIDLEPA